MLVRKCLSNSMEAVSLGAKPRSPTIEGCSGTACHHSRVLIIRLELHRSMARSFARGRGKGSETAVSYHYGRKCKEHPFVLYTVVVRLPNVTVFMYPPSVVLPHISSAYRGVYPTPLGRSSMVDISTAVVGIVAVP